MPYTTGEATNIYDLLEAIDSFVTSQAGWIKLWSKTYPYLEEDRLNNVIWMAPGDGNDKIYMNMRVPTDGTGNIMMLDAYAGYDEKLFYWEQPGSIQQWLKSEGEAEVNQPAFTVTTQEKYFYWIFANSYRLIVVARMSIVYESLHIGFLNPVSSERQYPYPMYVAGNTIAKGPTWNGNVTGSFIFPRGDTGWLRRADGTWRSFDSPGQFPDWKKLGTVFPYTACNKLLVPNYLPSELGVQDNLLLIPIMLMTNDPIDVNGLIRGGYWVSGTRDVAAEQIVTFNDTSFMIFDNKQDRGSNTYFCVELA